LLLLEIRTRREPKPEIFCSKKLTSFRNPLKLMKEEEEEEEEEETLLPGCYTL
jgi:hypothetical protein